VSPTTPPGRSADGVDRVAEGVGANPAAELEPLSVQRIYAESLRMWVANLALLTVLAVLLEAPVAIVELTLHHSGGVTVSTRSALAVNAVSLPLALYGSLSHHFLSGLLERLVGADRLGHPAPTLLVVLRDLPWVRLVVADVAATVIVVVGYVLFVVPGVIFATWLTPLLVIVNLERRSVRQSMVRSYQLVRGHFWRVFIVGFVAVAVVQIAVSLAGGVAGAISHSVSVEVIANAVPSALLMPIAALPIVFLTLDLVDLDRA
jgi:hypothetical protein